MDSQLLRNYVEYNKNRKKRDGTLMMKESEKVPLSALYLDSADGSPPSSEQVGSFPNSVSRRSIKDKSYFEGTLFGAQYQA